MRPGPEHYAKLERMYLGAPCNAQLELALKIGKGEAEVTMQATQQLHHAAGGVHGSYYFKMLDDAAFFAANSLVGEVFVLTASFTVELMRPVKTGTLRAVGRVAQAGRSLIFAESELFDERGRSIAKGTGIFARSKVRLEAQIGYV